MEPQNETVPFHPECKLMSNVWPTLPLIYDIRVTWIMSGQHTSITRSLGFFLLPMTRRFVSGIGKADHVLLF